jgi:hypothetical protein
MAAEVPSCLSLAKCKSGGTLEISERNYSQEEYDDKDEIEVVKEVSRYTRAASLARPPLFP